MRYLLFVGMVTTVLLGACSNQQSKLGQFSEQELYELAQNYLRRRQFILAVETLQQLESDHPFGKYANSAQLALIYAYYNSDELPLVTSAANRYIRLHPNHPNVDYAYYMRGLAAFPKSGSFFQLALGTDLSKRDMKSTRTSFVYFADMVKRFPESQYTPDAIKRMEYLRNLLGRYEIQVGNYYLERDAYLAAANRGRYVLENYQMAPAIPDALALKIQSYYLLGMEELADDALSVLKLNYPNYPAIQADGSFDYQFYLKGTQSLSGAITFGLIDRSRSPGFDTRDQYGEF